MRKSITVKDLKNFIDYYLETHSENDEIKLIDDGSKPLFFDPEILLCTKFERRLDDSGKYDNPINVLGITFNRYNDI